MKAVPPFNLLAIEHAVAIRASSFLGCEIHFCGGVHITRRGALQGTGEDNSDCEHKVHGERNPKRDPRDSVCIADSEEKEDHGGLDEGEDRVVEELVRDIVLPACDLLGDAKFRDVRFVVTLPGVEGV